VARAKASMANKTRQTRASHAKRPMAVNFVQQLIYAFFTDEVKHLV